MNHLQFRAPIGTIAVTWNSSGLLTRIDWYENGRLCAPETGSDVCTWSVLSKVEIPPVLGTLVNKLRNYFDRGEPLGELPWASIEMAAWSSFQREVYEALVTIPHGETRTYSWVARRLGKGAAPRAVGQALRRNPLPILIPCHRIVSANALGGFMGITDPSEPELKLKQWLIELESGYLNPVFSFLAEARRPAVFALEAVG